MEVADSCREEKKRIVPPLGQRRIRIRRRIRHPVASREHGTNGVAHARGRPLVAVDWRTRGRGATCRGSVRKRETRRRVRGEHARAETRLQQAQGGGCAPRSGHLLHKRGDKVEKTSRTRGETEEKEADAQT